MLLPLYAESKNDAYEKGQCYVISYTEHVVCEVKQDSERKEDSTPVCSGHAAMTLGVMFLQEQVYFSDRP